MGKLVEYQIALMDGGHKTYANSSVLAEDDLAAMAKAKEWASSLETRWKDAWLVLNDGSRGLSIKPGHF
jgi:hypothetical protein